MNEIKFGEVGMDEVKVGDMLIASCMSYVAFFTVLKRTKCFITIQELKCKLVATGDTNRGNISVRWFIPTTEMSEGSQPFRSKIKTYEFGHESHRRITFFGENRYTEYFAYVYADEMVRADDVGDFGRWSIVSKEEFKAEFEEIHGEYVE
jgi:hypothetical protein